MSDLCGSIFLMVETQCIAFLHNNKYYSLAQFQYFNNLLWLLAVVPVVLLYIGYEYWKKTIKKKAGNPKLISLMMQGVSENRNRLKIALIVVAIAFLAVAMLNYQKPVLQAGGGLKGIDIMIALDVSNSMMANDVSPNRLERARLLAARLIDTMQGNRVGIVAFAGDAYLQLPLTTDITAARLYLQSVSTGLVPRQGTDIYDALELVNQSMDPAAHQYKAVLLITDGEELDKKAMDAAKELKASGIVILPVGIGTPNGATLPGDNGGPRKDDKGEIVVSKLNEELLKQLATETNGTYRLMGETDETLKSIVAELKSMDQKPISNASLVNYKSYSPWLIAMAFILLLIEFFLPAKTRNKLLQQKVKAKKTGLKQAAVLGLLLCASFACHAQSTRILLHKANEAYRQNQYNDAEQLYQSVLKFDPANNVAKYNLGNIAYRRKQFEDAVDTYDDVTNQKQEKPQAAAGAWNNKGLSYVQQKDLPKAIESFKESIRKNPFDEEVRNNLMKALQEQQKQNQPKPDSNKKDPPKPKPQNKMKKNEAEEKLAALRQEEKKIRDKMKQPASGGTSDKEW